MKTTHMLTVATALGLALAAAPVSAQDQTVDGRQADADSEVDDDSEKPVILVTATRREMQVLDLPFSITALSGEQLVSQDKDDLADFIRQVPSVTFRQQSAGLNQISIRGVSGGGGQRAKAPVSFYIDDVPVVSDPVATPDIKTFDVNRVEVLMGPQGTLFGESAIGGVIRVITNDPNPNAFEASGRISYLNFRTGGDGYNLDTMLNVPLVEDKLALRAVISRRDEDGWIDNIGIGGRPDANDLDYWSGRAKLLFTPDDRLEMSAMYSFVRSEYGSRQEGNTDFVQVINFTNENRVDDIDQANFTFKYDFDAFELTSSSNYFKRTTSRLFNLNSFNGFLPGILESLEVAPAGFQFDEFAQTLDIDDESFVQEIRLVSTGDGPFRWVVGGFYFDTDNSVGVDFFGSPDLDFNYLRLRREETYSQIAGFAEVEYDLTERLTAIAGMRYTEEQRTIVYDQTDDFSFVVFLPANGLFEVDIDYGVLTPKFALQYRFNDDAQTYVSATRGFRGPGGNTDFNDDGIRRNVYDAETIWTYEIGLKGRFFDIVTFEGAAFYTDWKDRQEVVNPEAPFNEQFVSNIGSAEIKGVELGLTVNPVPALSFGGNVSYIDTEIVESANAAFEGLPLVGEPEWRGSMFIDTTIPISGDLDFVAHFDAAYSGSVIYSLANPVGSRQDGYWLANLSAGIRAENWAARLFVRNLTDEFIRYGVGQSTSINEPRVVGGTVEFNF